MISLEKLRILTPLRKLPKNVRDLGKFIVAKGFKKLPKVRKIALSGHTGCKWILNQIGYGRRLQLCDRIPVSDIIP